MENFDTWWNRMYSKISVNQKEMCRAAFEAGKAQSEEDVPEKITLGFCKLGQAGLHATTEPHQQTDDCIDWTPQEETENKDVKATGLIKAGQFSEPD